MPRGAKSGVQATTPATATTGSIWALMTGADPEKLSEWDYHTGDLAVLVGEVMQTGAAITFGAKRDLSGMSVRIYHDGAVVLQHYSDNVFDLNEWMAEVGQKLKTARLKNEAK